MRHLRKPETAPMRPSEASRRERRQRKRIKWIMVLSLVAALVLTGGIVTVVANTADITVLDDGLSYRFSVLGSDLDDILARAEAEGVPKLSDIDTYTFNEPEGILTIQRNVRVSVHDETGNKTVVAPRHELVGTLLASNGYILNAGDEVEPEDNTELSADTSIVVTRQHTVTVDADGRRTRRDVMGGTVADALQAAEITLRAQDEVDPPAETPLEDGMRIRVKRFVHLTVHADGGTYTFEDPAAGYEDALRQCGIEPGPEDRLAIETADGEEIIDISDPISDGASLHLTRIVTEEHEAVEEIPYETVTEYTDELYDGVQSRKVAGVAGSKRVVYRTTYADGELESEVPVEEEVLEPATNEVILIGTYPRSNWDVIQTGGTFVDSAGESVDYVKSICGTATAYYEPPGSLTAMGEYSQYGYVAVNPNVIPYGSLLYIVSPDGGYVYGYCVAMDTGGAAMSGDIVVDIFLNSEAECNAFGRRDMMIYILREGW